MGFKDGMRFTSDGLNLLAKVNGTEKELRFTRIAIGDGFFNGNINTLTNMISHKMDLPLVGIKPVGGQTEVKAWLTNASLETEFYYREKALFALDPDTKQEKLYAYGNAGNDAELICSKYGAEVIGRFESVLAIVDNAVNITADINIVTGISREELEIRIDLLKDELAAKYSSVSASIPIAKTEPAGLKDGEWWYEELDGEPPELPETIAINITTVPYDATKLFHIETDSGLETMEQVTDDEATAAEEDLILISL